MADTLGFVLGLQRDNDREWRLPCGKVLPVPEGMDPAAFWFRHCTASLAERLCPMCLAAMESAECYAPCHPPARWHLCPDREFVVQTYLYPDTGAGMDLQPCNRCGGLA